jgi:hypothetical protein
MKKALLVLLIIVFGFHSSLKASEHSTLEETKIERNSRNWSQEAKRFGYGVLALSASYAASSMIGDEDVTHIISMVSTYYLTSSLMNLGQYCLEWYTESVTKAQYALRRKEPQRRKITVQNSEKIDLAVQENIRLPRVFLRQTQSLLNATLKIGALYVLSQHYEQDRLLQAFIHASTLAGGLIYNMNELRHTYTTGQVRNDIPLLGILDAYCEALIAAQLFSGWSNRPLSQWSTTQEFKISPDHVLVKEQPFSSTEWTFYRFLQLHSDVQAIRGALQIPSNIISGFRSYFKREPQIIERHVITPPRVQNVALMPPPQAFSNLTSTAPNNVASSSSEIRTHHASSEPEGQRAQKIKVKRRGTPGAPHEAAPPLSQEEELDELPSPEDIIRTTALARIQALRQATTIKETLINQEIRQLLSFLTNSSLENIGHGKRAIIIRFKDGKSFRIIFEAPHEQSNAASDEYKGYRKTRVLEALQVGYLHGWSEKKILGFMNAHNINRFYNIPLFLLHILWERGHYR